jgi:N6-adenosine-specific RNA methylase IME4
MNALAAGPFDVILCDPPWFYNSRAGGEKRVGGKTRFGGGAEAHYALMSDRALMEMSESVKAVCAENCALFLWSTCPRLDFAVQLLKAWGFRYTTIAFSWIKRTKAGGDFRGPGFYTASNLEPVLLGVKGRMRPARRLVPSVVEASRGRHSVKPEEVQRRIEAMYPNSRCLEMFARETRAGWVAWGKEAPALSPLQQEVASE